ncbi:MAG TPA: thioredoxin family protein [Candidatus Bathyarchaeia archaeon]|nr:thioredoxin family protein [Candidatus Bathyarchaeia archaeon]
MKKQIGLIALSTLVIACVAFSGVASAQASSTQVLFFYSPMCSVCEQVKPLVEAAAAQTGVHLIEYDVSTSTGAGIAQANGVSGTPTIVIQGGQTLVGSVTEQQIITAIQAAVGPTVVKATPTPTPYVAPKVVEATPTPTPYVAAKVVKVTPTPYVAAKVVKTAPAPKASAQPSIEVVTPTPTTTTSTQTVPEFSLLGLGAPALLVGAIYLFLRRR